METHRDRAFTVPCSQQPPAAQPTTHPTQKGQYDIVADAKPPRPPPVPFQSAGPPGSIKERRDGPRQRTRLRSGKIADLRNHFVIECLFHDRSERGAKLRLPANVRLPNPFYLYDDETKTVATAQIAWRKLCVLGVSFIDEKDSRGMRETLAASMSKGFYAV